MNTSQLGVGVGRVSVCKQTLVTLHGVCVLSGISVTGEWSFDFVSCPRHSLNQFLQTGKAIITQVTGHQELDALIVTI